MTTFYLSTVVGQVPGKANVTEGTGAPTADVIVELGGGNTPITSMSRKYVINALLAVINWLETDAPENSPAGAGTVTLLP